MVWASAWMAVAPPPEVPHDRTYTGWHRIAFRTHERLAGPPPCTPKKANLPRSIQLPA